MVSSAEQLIELIQQVGFLPLLQSGVVGFSADEMVDPDCRYVTYPDGGWDWPLWKWKGPVTTEGDCVYGKFFAGKAGFVSRRWWPHLCNYRRSRHPAPEAGSIEEAILLTLREQGSMITRQLRRACGFDGPKMRSRFDAYVTRLQMSCRIITEDFVYPRDRHGHEYGWGWALLTTPEALLPRDLAAAPCPPAESHALMLDHLRTVLPQAPERDLLRLLG